MTPLSTGESDTPPPIWGVIRGLIFPVYLPSALYAIAQNAIQILLPLYALKLGGGLAMAAAMVGMRGIGTMLADVPSGLIVARFGDKAVMVVGLLVLIIMALGCAFTQTAWLVGLTALGFGAGAGMFLLARLTFITDTVQQTQRGRVISVMAGLHRAGALLGPLVGGFSAELIGYEPVFMGAAVLFAVCLVTVMIFSKGSQRSEENRTTVPIRQIIRAQGHTFVTAGIVMVTLSFLRHGRVLMIPLVGVSLGLGESEIGIAFSLSSLVDMLMFLPAGLILDHAGRKYALAPSLFFLGAAIVLLPLATGFVHFCAIAMLAGLGNGFGTGIFMTLGGDFSPPCGRSEFLGIWRLVGDAGGAMGPFVMGTIAGATTLAVAGAWTGGLAVIGLIILFRYVPETLHHETSDHTGRAAR
ncbi:MAG: MFS transporter [Pseudomonadota bacterium]|nr:MFS transporter [Pseudomonadota bacterium]